MKSIIKQRVYEKSYYVGYLYYKTRQISYNYIKVEDYKGVPDNVFDVKVCSNNTYLEEIILTETQKFNREIQLNETIIINNEKYTVGKVEHNTDGSLVYYVCEDKIIDNQESLIEAETLLCKYEVYQEGYKLARERAIEYYEKKISELEGTHKKDVEFLKNKAQNNIQQEVTSKWKLFKKGNKS